MVAVLVGIAAVAVFDLQEEGVEVLGVLPQGLPTLALPAVDLADLGALFSGALGIALVAVADTTVLSQSLASQRNEVDPDRSSAPSAPPTWPPACSRASPSPAAPPGRWPWPPAPAPSSPLIGAVAIALLLVFAPGLLRDLPCVLAAIVITAAVGLIDVAAVRRLYRVRSSEFVLWLAAFGEVALLGVLVGIFRGHPAVAGRLRPPGLASPRRRPGPRGRAQGLP